MVVKKNKYLKIGNVLALLIILLITSCKKDSEKKDSGFFEIITVNIAGNTSGPDFKNIPVNPEIIVEFSEPADPVNAQQNITIRKDGSTPVSFSVTESGNTLKIVPARLSEFSDYTLTLTAALKSKTGAVLNRAELYHFSTSFDTTDKFERITDEELLTLVQKQTFKYFWDFGHPVSGMARERNTSGDLVTTGGTGFGIMAVITAIHRNFISREEGLQRISTITDFLVNKVEKIQGAFPHWVNGITGATIPFSEKDNGADLVETSLLLQGLITAREYFNGNTEEEITLRNNINLLWENVNWNFFRKNQEQVLYWHYSNNYAWDMNLKIQGWNESLITYVLAASSPTHPIPRQVYDEGWARSGAMRNGNNYYNINLPLGPHLGGPLFFAHYSFLGLDPGKLRDSYADYEVQNRAHSLIQYEYAKEDPKNYGYSEMIWGLTASDNNIGGYSAHSPSNDLGIIAPTAALSSFPYTPEESMKALHTFYYKLGTRLWKEYGFADAFSPSTGWVADSFLAINQGPIIIMIENYRSGLLWDLFMNAPEIKNGLTLLGFQPY